MKETRWDKLPFQIGDEIQLGGLFNAAYNGQEAIVRDFNFSKLRYVVELRDGKRILIKPQNLNPNTTGNFAGMDSESRECIIKWVRILDSSSPDPDLGTLERAERELFPLLNELVPTKQNSYYRFWLRYNWVQAMMHCNKMDTERRQHVAVVANETIRLCDHSGYKMKLLSLVAALKGGKEAIELLRPNLDAHHGCLAKFVSVMMNHVESCKEAIKLYQLLEKEPSTWDDNDDHNVQNSLLIMLMKQVHFQRDLIPEVYSLMNDMEARGVNGEIETFNLQSNRGSLLMMEGRFEEALRQIHEAGRTLETIVTLVGRNSPENFSLLHAQCTCYQKLGDKTKAKKLIKRMKKMGAKNFGGLETTVRKMRHIRDVEIDYEVKRSCGNPYCNKIETVLKQFSMCSRCKMEFYCSEECQRKHWPTHKKICRKKGK